MHLTQISISVTYVSHVSYLHFLRGTTQPHKSYAYSKNISHIPLNKRIGCNTRNYLNSSKNNLNNIKSKRLFFGEFK